MQYCLTCVSSNRSCVMLSDRPEIWEVINLLNVDMSIATNYICWECEYLFKRMVRFRRQILQAQEVLRNCPKLFWIGAGGESTKKIQLESLSQLTTVTKDIYDKIYIEIENKTECNFLPTDSEYLEADLIIDWDSNEEVIEKDIDVKTNENTPIENETVEHEMEQIKDEEKTVVKDLKLSRDEQMFKVNTMTMAEMFKTRDMIRKGSRYKSCPYKCGKCIRGYFEENKYKRHLRLHDVGLDKNKNLKKCPICELWFRRGEPYGTHYDRHFRRYTCKTCGFTHHKLEKMRLHQLKEHNKDGVYICKLCNETFDRPRSLRYHYESAHREKPKCDVCGKVVSTKSNLKIHMLVHTGVPRAACAMCGRVVRASCLRTHLRTHAPRAPDAPYCAECDLTFASQHLYSHHLTFSRRHRQEDQLKHVCSQCPSKFVSKYALSLHVAAKHLKAYPYKCDICGKAFVRKCRVKEHIMQKHEGKTKPKDKICGYCGKAFNSNAVLKNHVRIHTGERPFACAHCPATFTQKSTMYTHAKALHKDVVNT